MNEFPHIERFDRFMAAGDSYAAARAVIFGIPMDFTTSFRPGARGGPARIREVSYGLEEFSYHQARDLKDVKFYDLGEVAVAYGNVAATLERARLTTARLLADDKLPIMLGGEHLCTAALRRPRRPAGRLPGRAALPRRRDAALLRAD